jgi:ketosteroid isomerase-like protein
MSEGNVEIVRRAWQAWERGDWEPLYAFYHPDIVWDASALRGPIAGVYHGQEGVRRYFREWLESFEAHDARAEKFIAAGDDVIVRLRLRGRGKKSGVEVEMSRLNVYRIKDGLAIRVELFETEAEALEAVGLRGQNAHADS